MARKKDGLEISNVSFREGSGPYLLAQLAVGAAHTDSELIPHEWVSREEITDTTVRLNRKWSSWIARAKKAGVRVESSTARGITDCGDVVITLVIKRVA